MCQKYVLQFLFSFISTNLQNYFSLSFCILLLFSFHLFNLPELTRFPFFLFACLCTVHDANSFIYGVILVPCRLIRDRVLFSAALLHLVRSQGQDVHDDVQTVAECAARQGQQIQFVTLCFGLYFFSFATHGMTTTNCCMVPCSLSSFLITGLLIFCSLCAPKSSGTLFISAMATSSA